ncbi:MAG: BrnT family toxin [Snowella sp.]|nr:BrnT family toxin [Snowella sp.]
MKFEWDQQKAQSNLIKHGIPFEEAQTVFDDPLYVDFYDPDHSETENRYIIIGTSSIGHVLLLSYTERGDIIRAC